MILGAFGDSFLFGSDLSDVSTNNNFEHFYPSSLTYTALLAKKFNLEYYCTARPGQSNKIIADDVIRAISFHKDSMFYIINWSWIDRYEYISEDNSALVRGWCSILPTDNTDLSKTYYKNFYSDLNSKLSNLLYVYSVLGLLQEYRCKFIMTNMDSLMFDKKFNCTYSIDLLQNKIESSITYFEGQNFLDYSKKYHYEISENWHPLEEAHEAAADYLFPMANHLLHTKYPGGQNK